MEPLNPALRANSFPEVTDLFCQLPLPTLFYRPEAQSYVVGQSYRYSRHRAAVLVSGMDSVLEAFKHNPTDGSFSPLAAQLSENNQSLVVLLE